MSDSNMNSYRCKLEVLKFASPKDLLLSAAVLSRAWSLPAESDELWWSLSEDVGADMESCQNVSGKQFFRAIHSEFRLVFIREATIKLVDLRNLEVSEITLEKSTEICPENAYCFLNYSTVLCLGAKNKPSVFEINLRTLKITDRNPMSDCRVYPGVLKHKGFVYVFGGRRLSSEKYSLKTHVWTPIQSNLHEPLEALTPALHLDQVFLVGHKTVEVFHLPSEVFTVVEVTLPLDWWYVLATIDKEELVAVQQGVISRWIVGSNDREFRTTPVTSLGSGYYSNCPPLRYKGILYSIHNDIPDVHGVLELDLKSNRFTQVITWNHGLD